MKKTAKRRPHSQEWRLQIWPELSRQDVGWIRWEGRDYQPGFHVQKWLT